MNLTIEDIIAPLTEIARTRGMGGQIVTNVERLHYNGVSVDIYGVEPSDPEEERSIESLESELTAANVTIDELERALSDAQEAIRKARNALDSA